MMRFITLFFFLSIGLFSFAQNISTGVVPLSTGFSVQFDVNTTTDIVSMTMVGPDDVWLGIALNTNLGNSMGSDGADAFIYSSSGLDLLDRHMSGGFFEPNVDASQDWVFSSNTTSLGVRTIVATRARDTNDPNDFVFPTTNTSLPLLWALGTTANSFDGHSSSSRGVAMTTLSASKDVSVPKFKIYPNPVEAELTIKFPSSIDFASVSVFNTLGELVFQSNMNQWNSQINTSEWNAGIYLLTIRTSYFSETKRLINH